MKNGKCLECTGIVKKYGSFYANNDINLSFIQGVTVILGNNGSGKSTFINMVVGNLKIDEGQIKYNGEDIHSKKYRSILGFLPQECDYYENFTGIDFLYYIGCLKGMKKSEYKKQAEEFLKVFNLWEFRKRKVGAYSGGMKRRLGICQAFMGNPEIIILDEPTTGLDYNERIIFANKVKEYGKNHIVIVSTHIFEEAEYIADRYVMISKGKNVYDAPACEIESITELFNKFE